MRNLSLESRGPAAWLTFAGNLDADAAGELRSACETIAGDDSWRAAVIRIGRAAAAEAGEPLTCDPFACLAECPKPVICAMAGRTSGAWLALALAADIRVAPESATFAVPEAAAGRLPAAGTIQRLARLVGRGKALEMVLTGDEIDAAEALRIGLVSETVPADRLDKRAQQVAERLAERGPVALQFAKEAISRGIDMSLEQALRFETDLTVILQTTEDRAEGVQAFREKRKPKFKGK